jgi:hypothetical protein
MREERDRSYEIQLAVAALYKIAVSRMSERVEIVTERNL